MPMTMRRVDPAVDAQGQRRLADAERTDLVELVDTDRYPLRRRRARLQAEIARVREDLDRERRAAASPRALEQARDEGRELSTRAITPAAASAPGSPATTKTSPSDPRRHFMERTSGFVTRDMIPPNTVIQQLYVSPAMKRLVTECLQRTRSTNMPIRSPAW